MTLPQRITDSLVKDINHFHIPGKREIVIITHFEHPYEITHQAMEAVQKFRREGIDGVFGPGTKTAVIAFQTAEGLMPDGIVGPASRSRLGIDL